MLKNLIQANKISYKTDQGQLLFADLNFSIHEKEKIALTGINGIGKSSLIQIIADQKQNSYEGELSINSKSFYLPQSPPKSTSKIFEYISESNELWWDVITIMKTYFNIVINPEDKLETLSGGELTILNISIGISLKPDLFILDEPTNHLDSDAEKALTNFIKDSNSAFLIVTHNPHFIDQWCNQTWELSGGSLTKFSGSYTEFREYKRTLELAKTDSFNAAKKEILKAKHAQLKETMRAAKTNRLGKLMAKTNDRSIPKIMRNAMRNSAQKAHGRNKDRLEKNQNTAIQRLEENKATIRKLPGFIQHSAILRSGTLISLTNNTLLLPNDDQLLSEINFKVNSSQRVAITGRNGSGKSSFAKSLILNDHYKLEGDAFFAPSLKIEYISQKYDLVKPSLTLIENIKNFSLENSEEFLMKNLGNMLFTYDDLDKKAEVLSGGEIARLSFAMILSRQPDLLILDEPTNNLDLETVDAIVEGLNNYKGAVLVISHNQDFLNRINITDSYKIHEKKLTKVQSSL